MKKVISIAVVALLTGCAPMINQTISGGDAGVVNEGSRFALGTTYSQKTPMPQVKKFPIKIKGWGQLSKETRDRLEPYVYTTGNYVQAELKPEFKSLGDTKSGFGGGDMVLKNTAIKDFTFMILSWDEDANILIELPIHGESTVFKKTRVGDYGDMSTGYIMDNQKFAEENAAADFVTKLEANRAKIEDIAKKYQASKKLY